MPGALHTRSLVCSEESIRVRHHGHAETIRHSLRNGLRLRAALLGDRALVASVADEHFRQLDPSVGGTGPHAFAVRTGALRLLTPIRPSHPAPTFRDDREAPLFVSAGWVGISN
jgi:hypothetical protein